MIKNVLFSLILAGSVAQLSAEEAKKADKPKAEKASVEGLKALDKNSDGAVSKEELAGATSYAKYDKNSDGALSKEEFDAAVTALEKKAKDHKKK